MVRTALLLGALAVTTVLGSDAALADVRLECDVEGPRDISLSARYEERTRTGRQKFSAEFEAAPRAGYTAGQRMVMIVDGVNVGSVLLKTVVGGDVQGDLNLDTAPQSGERPFPANFPEVKSGSRTTVRIAGENILSCRLRP